MLSTASTHSRHFPIIPTLGIHKREVRFRKLYDLQLYFPAISFRRIGELFVKAANNRGVRKAKPKYTLTVREPSAKRPENNTRTTPIHSAGTKNDSLTPSTITNGVPARLTLANQVASLPADSLEMNANSKAACTSRGGSNQSTSQSFIDAYLARRKRDEIDRLMEMLEGWIDSLAVTSHALGAGSSSRPGASSHSGSSTSSTPPKNISGQKRSLRRDSLDDSDPGRDGNDGEKRGNKRPKVETPSTLKLACPFYKCEPGKYRNRQACTGPGWSSISRLKEHIYRAHRQPDYKCKRCCKVFTNEEKLEEHQRADEPCKVSKGTAVDGITESQYHQLRKKPVGQKSPEERWRELYLIIFPKATKIPTSYYDGYVPECGSEGLDFNYLENELLSEVRNALEERVDEVLEEHRNGFLEIVKTSLERLKMQFFQQHNSSQTESSQPAMEIPGFPDPDFFDFSQLVDQSNFDYNDPYWFDPSVESRNYSSDISDSAYVSLDSPKSPLKG